MHTITLPASTRANLAHASFLKGVGSPKAAPAVEDQASLLLRIDKLTRELSAERKRNAERAHREERVRAITVREVDRIAEWYAKQPKARTPHVLIKSEKIVTADVWENGKD